MGRDPLTKPSVAAELEEDPGATAADVAAAEAAEEAGPAGRRRTDRVSARFPSLLGENADLRLLTLIGLFVLASIYTLHLARGFFLPIVLALLLDFLLSPVIRALGRFRIPAPVAAALVMVGFLAVVGGAVYSLSGPAAAWVARAPESIDRIRDRLEGLRGPMETVTRAAEQVQEATDVDGETPAVEIRGPSLMKQVFGGTTAFLGAATTVVFLTFFLLAAGELFLAKLIKVLPQFSDKRRAVLIAREIESQVSTYLFTSTLINTGLGVVTTAAMTLLGMPNAVLWGVVAAVLNFIPYVGAVATTAILGLAALLAFEDVGRALLVPGAFFVINMLEGNLITPAIMGHRLTLNTVALFVGLIFWWFVWGIAGAILAVPIMATIKIFCDHFESLAPVGEFLGR